jgi:hypothetical protein
VHGLYFVSIMEFYFFSFSTQVQELLVYGDGFKEVV